MRLFKKGQIAWTETARVKLVEAVIKVEKEMVNESNRESRRPAINRIEKWSRIADLLPPDLRERTWNPKKQKFREYKCARQFFILLYSYRDEVAGKATKSARIVRLTEPVFKIIKKREDLLSASCLVKEKSPFQSENSKEGVDSIETWHDDDQQLSTKSNSWGGQSVVGKEGAGSFSDYTHDHELECTDTHHNADVNKVKREERNHADHDDDTGEDGAYPTLGSRVVHTSKQVQKIIPAFRNCVQTSSEGGPTRAERRAEIVATGSTSRSSIPMAYPMYNEHLHAILDGPLRRLDRELSSLRSWVQNVSVKAIISSAIVSGKRRRLNVPTGMEPSDKHLEENLSTIIDFRIRALFQKLRIQVAGELNSIILDYV